MIEQFKFLNKIENKVIAFRVILFFLIFLVVGFIVPRFVAVSSINDYTGIRMAAGFGTMVSLVAFLLLYVFSVYRAKTDLVIGISTIIQALVVIWFIRIFGPINGSLFFFFLLVVMESAFTLNESVIFIVGLIGIISSLSDYVILGGTFDVNSILMLFLRIVVLVAVALYSTALAKRIREDQLKGEKLRESFNQLKLDKEKLIELDMQQTQFLNISAHELNTPLSAIEGYLSMIVDEKDGQVDEVTGKRLKLVYQSSRRLARIVKEMVDVFKVDSARISLDKSEFDLAATIEEVIKHAEPKINEKNIYIRFTRQFEGHTPIFADQLRVKEILEQLVDNAVKFTDTGGVEVILGREDETYKVEVIDTGIGISVERQKNLFSKFYQIESAESPNRAPGTGLGLYLAKAYVQMHGGKIGLESNPNLGSRFWVNLPVKS